MGISPCRKSAAQRHNKVRRDGPAAVAGSLASAGSRVPLAVVRVLHRPLRLIVDQNGKIGILVPTQGAPVPMWPEQALVYAPSVGSRVRMIFATMPAAVGSGQRTYSVVIPSGSITFSYGLPS